MTDYQAYDAGLPCRNPNCKSRGRPHPNCRCWASSAARDEKEYAHGGSVCSANEPHEKGCAYYAEGGDIQPSSVTPMSQAQPMDDLPGTLGHAAVHHGLLGLLREVGHPRLAEPEKHLKTIHKATEKQDPEKIADLIHEHPLSGGASRKSLSPIMGRLAQPLQSQEPHPEGLRSAIDYLNSSMKGQDKLKSHFSGLLGSGKMKVDETKESRDQLKKHLDSLQEDPSQMLDIGGSLGHYLPDHAAALGYQSAIATQYLNGIKPKTTQLAPLDTLEATDKAAEAKYDRQLDIAQNPLLVLQHVKDGTLLPSDLMTVSTLYPGLHKVMVKQATEQLVEAKTKDMEIPYKQKQTMSMLLGQPLDFTQSPMAMQAIMKSSLPMQEPQEPQGKGQKRSGATAAELKQINKVDEMYETPLEARALNKNRH